MLAHGPIERKVMLIKIIDQDVSSWETEDRVRLPNHGWVVPERPIEQEHQTRYY